MYGIVLNLSLDLDNITLTTNIDINIYGETTL